ncbi:MAG: glycosyltransferase family 4 protein [Gloeocapsa sp. DLM2.Bin57]|nr:MAG: glycosyltransferase family 4 protein [Gloeocapsa sp. DLM2.Bin57]
MIPLLSLVIASGLLAVVIVGIIRNYLVLDIPNERSSHSQPTPRGGGLGFVIAFAITSGIYSWLGLGNYWGWWLVLLPLIIVAIIDDYRDLPAIVRYLVQLVTALGAIALFGYVNLPGVSNQGLVASLGGILLTIIAITAMINFVNFMDGLDGLVASCAAIELGWLAIYLHQPGLWLLVAALLGFLYWNWSLAQIFMGDTGSTFLGAIVALVILSSGEQPYYLWTAFGMSLPLISDAIYTLARRLSRKENIFQAHRTHIYQRLQQQGWSHSQVAISYSLLTLLMGGLIFVWGVTGVIIGLAIIILSIITAEYYIQSNGKIAIE